MKSEIAICRTCRQLVARRHGSAWRRMTLDQSADVDIGATKIIKYCGCKK